jgi:hypothetical protein
MSFHRKRFGEAALAIILVVAILAGCDTDQGKQSCSVVMESEGTTVTEATNKERPGTLTTYDEFVERARTIKVGMESDWIIRAIGQPTRREGDVWVYGLMNLPGFPGVSGSAGVQVFTYITFTMDRGKVANVQWGWIDATGPASDIRKR